MAKLYGPAMLALIRELKTKDSPGLLSRREWEMQFQLDRTMPITIGHQLKGQIVHSISRGFLRAGDQMPSLRELATTLSVSYATVATLYHELAEEGLLVTQRGKGTFVADLTRAEKVQESHSSQLSLHHLAAKFVSQTYSLGYSPDQILSALRDCMSTYDAESTIRYVMVVGYARSATASYAQKLEELLSKGDLRARVQPVLLDDLRTDCKRTLSCLHPVSLAITPPHALKEVRDLLEPLDIHVASAAFELCAETRRGITSIEPGARVGVVATGIEYLPSLLRGVASYIPTDCTVLHAVRDQVAEIKQLLQQIDVLVYHTGCEAILEWVPPHVETIEYLHSPEPDSVARLRPLLLR